LLLLGFLPSYNGSFYVTVAILAIGGVANSEEKLPIQSLLVDLLYVIFYGSLLLPYRKISSNRVRIFIFGLLSIQALWVLYVSIHNSIINYGRDDSWKLILGLLFMLLIVFGNLWAYFLITNKFSLRNQDAAKPSY